MRKLIIFAIAAGVAACSTIMPQPAPAPDDSPTNPTAVLETHVINGGIMGLLPFESTEKRYVRANMRREENSTKGTGTFTGFFLTRESDTSIERLDRNVRWTLNNSKKEYTECPVHGCTLPPSKERQADEKTSEPKAKTESGCIMQIAKTSFNVKPTGEKREINGFNADQYQIEWLVTMQDNAHRKTTSTLNIELWTTPTTAEMRQALGVKETFDRAYAASAPRAQPAAAKKSEVLPPEVTRMMLGYLSSGLSASDRVAFVSAGREIEKIKGRPISTHIEWSLEGNACASKAEGAGDVPRSASTGPILSFTIELKSLKVEPVHDSVFSVPKDYKIISQR
ncbi:MAG TPA: hypothetical protein VIW72_02045 [Burkholderiales bacterium]